MNQLLCSRRAFDLGVCLRSPSAFLAVVVSDPWEWPWNSCTVMNHLMWEDEHISFCIFLFQLNLTSNFSFTGHLWTHHCRYSPVQASLCWETSIPALSTLTRTCRMTGCLVFFSNSHSPGPHIPTRPLCAVWWLCVRINYANFTWTTSLYSVAAACKICTHMDDTCCINSLLSN